MKSQKFLNEFQLQMNKDFDAQNPELFDTVFEIDGKKLFAHKYRLSAMSTTFKAMLSDRWNSKNEPIKIIGYSFEDFKEFLKFIYSGECSINDENIFAILDLAEFYHINHLKELCDTYLSKMKMNVGNIFKLMETSNKYSMETMKHSLQTYISQNFSKIVKSDTFLNADISIIEELVNLQLQPEDIFEAVYEWSEYRAKQKREESTDENFNLNAAIKSVINPFLPNIRFKKMHQTFLNTYVGKRGFLFANDELSDILDNANPDLKVTVTNSKGESIYANLDPTLNAQAMDVIKSLRNRKSDNTDHYVIYWKTKCVIPDTPSSLKRKDDVKWYLLYFSDGDIGVRNGPSCDATDYLIAEMFCDNSFSFSRKCKIEIE